MFSLTMHSPTCETFHNFVTCTEIIKCYKKKTLLINLEVTKCLSIYIYVCTLRFHKQFVCQFNNFQEVLLWSGEGSRVFVGGIRHTSLDFQTREKSTLPPRAHTPKKCRVVVHFSITKYKCVCIGGRGRSPFLS